MRNLKKFLALVLAMVMAFSLMVTANAASTKNGTDVYPDGEQILTEFLTSVDVLYGMGVMKGNNGSFLPKNSIMRCEAVAILYRLATGDVTDSQVDLYKPLAARFNDVPQDAWYAGYVGYAVDAQLINGYNGDFMPTKNVTGYEMLKMLLKAVGYGKNGEFTGTLWQVNVGSQAQALHILDNINSTHYANTLSQFSPREVVADLTFQTAAIVPTVRYELGYYNPWVGVASGQGNNVRNRTLGEREFGLAHKTDGVVIGNQDTGESQTVVGTAGTSKVKADGTAAANEQKYSAYAWNGAELEASEAVVIGNERYNVVTGVEMIDRKIDLWYCDGEGTANGHFKTNDVYAYYDASTKTAIVESADADLTSGLKTAAEAAGFSVPADGAVFNNFFGKAGSAFTGDSYGDGKKVTNNGGSAITNSTSPVGLYALISNSGDTLDAVIPLNIETSRITESNAVRGIPTVAVPVNNGDTSKAGVTGNFISSRSTGTPKYISANNVKVVSSVDTGVIAQAALVHDSTTTLYDYEMGVHINGTTPRNVSTTEKEAILATGDETAYYLLNKVDEFVTGKVIAYNADQGIVTLEVNGQVKTLNRSQFYNTVVCTNAASVSATVMPQYALPQSVALLNNEYVESYNFADYKFYLDYAGNYLGAERTFPNDFFYGTYVDYDQKTSSSTFKYYLTGVTLDGKVETREITDHYTWNQDQASRVNTPITGTGDLGAPFRDTYGTGGKINGLNVGQGYTGFTYTSGLVDPNVTAGLINVKDYAVNMERLGVIRAMAEGSTFSNPNATDGAMGIAADDSSGGRRADNGMMRDIFIGETAMTLGAVQTEANGVDSAANNSNLYLTEDTKIILVKGYGEDTCEPEVYNGISDLVKKNEAKSATIHLNVDTQASGKYTGWMNGTNDPDKDTPYAAMTYFMKDPDVFNQSGDTAQRVAVVILPRDAVTFDKSTSSTFFMGDPNYSLISSHEGNLIYQYTVYDLEGNDQQVWLTNAPAAVYNDTFLTLGNSIGKASDGKDVFTATFYNQIGLYQAATNGRYPNSGLIDGQNAVVTAPGTADTPTSTVIYQTTTRDALTATFGWCSSGNTVTDTAFLKVQGANVTNLNAANSPALPNSSSGYVWPGITDLATLNAAGSINPVTGTPVRVAAVVDGLTVTQIFVCWDQNAST
ncbi:MAG: S-layer homology domain-containing protein [Clostridiales bacterium]|nr:S-layer homology domain-containing protein [Clostridiales bacterium]